LLRALVFCVVVLSFAELVVHQVGAAVRSDGEIHLLLFRCVHELADILGVVFLIEPSLALPAGLIVVVLGVDHSLFFELSLKSLPPGIESTFCVVSRLDSVLIPIPFVQDVLCELLALRVTWLGDSPFVNFKNSLKITFCHQLLVDGKTVDAAHNAVNDL
jgi:hypothetical protein